MADNNVIRVRVYRSPFKDQEAPSAKGEYKEYEILYEERMTILTILDYIYKNCDRSLGYYKSCRIGKCSGCLVQVNGKNKLACTTLAKDGMTIGPAKGYEVIRDLVVVNT